MPLKMSVMVTFPKSLPSPQRIADVVYSAVWFSARLTKLPKEVTFRATHDPTNRGNVPPVNQWRPLGDVAASLALLFDNLELLGEHAVSQIFPQPREVHEPVKRSYPCLVNTKIANDIYI